MKIAVLVKHEMLYQHFGMASSFKLYNINNGYCHERSHEGYDHNDCGCGKSTDH